MEPTTIEQVLQFIGETDADTLALINDALEQRENAIYGRKGDE